MAQKKRRGTWAFTIKHLHSIDQRQHPFLWKKNPNDTTIFSESVGSSSLSSHLLSSISYHLVKQAILQSGVVSTPWAHVSAESAKNFSQILAKDVGCFTEDLSTGEAVFDETATMNCLRGVDARSITKAQGNSYLAVFHYSWAPTVSLLYNPL